ncbi:MULTISPECIES: hypothetical protein [unclassified Kribbella]|uniref:hypothetical protein n=1 Tax=unclassified Kribbella TaxID=2644121 RepID=UPI003077CDE1
MPIVAFASRETGASVDAYFDGSGLQLIARRLLAATRGGQPVSRVYSWLTDANNTQPENLLRDHGDIAMAESVEAVRAAPEKQRGGVFGTAHQVATGLGSSRVAPWVNPGTAPRPEFNPHQFVRRGGTLYSLSREVTTYRDHGATGPRADQTVWDDTTDHARITQSLYALSRAQVYGLLWASPA